MNYLFLDVDYCGVFGGFVYIMGGFDFMLKEVEGIVSNIIEWLEVVVNVIWGVCIQDEYKGKVCVMVIMMGVQFVQVFGFLIQKQVDKLCQSIQF